MLIPLLLALALAPSLPQEVEVPAWSRLRSAAPEGPRAEETSAAIDAGLAWLATHQAADGSWADDPGTSALAVLAFLARRSEGETLERGLDHLAASVATANDPRDGAILALALVEGAALGREDLRDAASSALARFESVPDADLPTPVVAWRALAATIAGEAGLAGGPTPADVRSELTRRSRASGAVERSREDPGDRFRGVGAVLLARSLMGDADLARIQTDRLVDRRARPAWPSSSDSADDEVAAAWVATAVASAVRSSAEVPGPLRAAVEARYAPGAALPERIAPAVLLRALLHEAGPEGEWRSALDALAPTEATDPMDLFFGAFATYQVGGELWKEWDLARRPIVLARIGEDGGAGSVRETALAALTLEVYYRYSRAIGGR